MKKKLLYGVGIKDSTTPSESNVDGKRIKCPYYSDWSHMLERCFSSKFKSNKPTYENCTVCDEWKYLSNFIKWVDSQPNRDWEKCHLDKDLLVEGNKHYSPETCVYIKPELNVFLTDRHNCRGIYPLGVHLEKSSGKYKAQINNPFTGKYINLGRYSSPEEAHSVWKKKKCEFAIEYSKQEHGIRIISALTSRFI